MENKQNKAVVILSGGCDSVTLLHWANKHYSELEALTFDYGSKHNKSEQVFAKYHCDKLKIPHKIITMDWNAWGFKSNLLLSGEAIPQGHYAADNMKSTVVPFRNGIMLSIATGYAESVKANTVLLGSHKGDSSQYPDCRREFTQAISLASQLGTYNNVEIKSPFNDLMKWDIVKLGLELNVDYSNTWSCYSPTNGRPCLKCGTDVERTESFYRNGVRDPLLTKKEWKEGVKYMLYVLKDFEGVNHD